MDFSTVPLTRAMHFSGYGFKYPENLIMSYIGGSQAHGAKVEGTDDTDYFGLFIEPISVLTGLDRYEHFVYTTGGQKGGNGPKDVDVTLFSLRKWAGLAIKGNPSCLHFMFAWPEYSCNTWKDILWEREAFLCKKHVKAFLGFADDQMKRLLGEKGQKNVHRRESEEKFGFDTKYAMHILRLYGEAIELMQTGHITLPRPNKSFLIDVRLGKYKLSEIKEAGRELEATAIASAERSQLPAEIDRLKVNRILTLAHRNFWEQNFEI